MLTLHLVLALATTIHKFLIRMRQENAMHMRKENSKSAVEVPALATKDAGSPYTYANEAFREDSPQVNQKDDMNAESIEANPTQKSDEMTWYMKLSWFLFNTVQSTSIIVSVVYFGALYPRRVQGGYVITLDDLNAHAFNSLIILLEVGLSALPVRLVHVVFPIAYGTVYVTVNAIYWSMDKVNNVVYPGVLDWNYPANSAVVVALLALVVFPLLQLLFFGLYRLRLLLYSKLYREEYS